MKIDFKTAAVTISDGIVTATFRDGVVNEMNTNWLDVPWYHDIGREMGFGDDWRYYAVTHEITHHWLADRLAWNWSWSVHDNMQYEGEWPAHIAWEEHIVNQLQRHLMTGLPDKHRVLDAVFGGHLHQADRTELSLLYARVK